MSDETPDDDLDEEELDDDVDPDDLDDDDIDDDADLLVVDDLGDDEDEVIPAVTELEFGIRDDDAFLFGQSRSATVHVEAQFLHLCGRFGTDSANHFAVVDVDVV